jgi:hypothetical protein
VGLLRVHADRMRRRQREHELADRFTAAHPDVPVVEVPARPQDVHDLDGLREIAAAMARAAPETRTREGSRKDERTGGSDRGLPRTVRPTRAIGPPLGGDRCERTPLDG